MAAADDRDLKDRLAGLSPAQRALLEQRLLQRQTKTAQNNLISRRDADGPVPLSYAQELLWLLSQVFDGGIAYNSPAAFHLQGRLDLELLGRAFDALVERHSILRTTYHVIGGGPMQVIGPPEPLELNVVDLRGLEPDDQKARSQAVLKEEARYRFDLENGPVIRPTIIHLGDDEHLMMLNLHHVATDGYSRGVLFRDLTAIYDALQNGLPSPLEPLAIQYADFAVWQRNWLDGGIADAQLDYWTRRLKNAPSRLDLPTDLPRPPVRSWVGENMSVMVELASREALRAVARQGDATLFVALVAIFGMVLSRWSGQDDIVVGTPFAGRNRTELESMVGYFINPLALRLDLSGDPTFVELLARVRETVVQAFAHADIPYESVVRAINPQRDLSQTPVFQAMIVFHNPGWQTQRPKFEPEGIRCTEITHEKGWAKFDVLIGMSERSSGLNTTWEYSTELFRPPTVRRMMEHFRALVESAGASPDRRVSALSMLSDAERAKVLVAWNPRAGRVPDQDSVKELFEEQAARTPQAPAVAFDGTHLSYGELNRRANRIAWMLRQRGAGPGDRIGILMDKSLDLLPAVLGVVKSGAAYVPIDPDYPSDRIEFMITDSSPKLLLTHSEHRALIPVDDSVVVMFDTPAVLDGFPEENPPRAHSADDIVYVEYTSGSTGQPKGALIAHRSLASLYHAEQRVYRLPELTAHAQLASFSFDVFTGDMTRALLSGAKLVLVTRETLLEPASLYSLIVEEGIDAAEFVPATATLLFEWAEREGKRMDQMKLVIVASEAWRTEQYEFFKRLCGPETRLLNSYGLTEATIDSTWFEPDDHTTDLQPGRFMPIGRPLDNTRVYVLDQNLEPQPIGIPGELCIGGVAVARGYLNRPELTAERFLPDPFSGEPGALLYRTGDQARWLADGTVDFLGRTDRQIKIRGFRIEPGEIEAVLEQHPRVRAAAVVDRADPRGEVRLVGYVEPLGDAPDPSELRGFVGERVPNYMIPSAFAALAELPYLPNGKLNRDALPDPEWDQRTRSTEAFLAPSTDTERRLAEIWSAVLSVEEISIEDDFFALGGHSLTAMRVMSRVQEEFGVKLLLRAVFDHPTIGALADAIDAAASTPAPGLESAASPIRRAARRATELER